MTTITAKQTRSLRGSLPRLAPLAAAVAAMLVSPASLADWRFDPSIGITQTWTDNLYLQPDELARTQLVSEITPAFNLAVNNRRLKAVASGSWRQFFYSRSDSLRARNDNQGQYGARLQGILAEDVLFIDASANSRRQSVSAFGPQAINNPFSTLNNTEVKTWSISPYLVQRFGRQATAVLRYTRDSVETDQRTQFGNTTSDTVLLNVSSNPELRALGWGLSYLHQDQDNELAGKSSVENLNTNLRYRLNREFALTASAGYDRYDYNALGGKTAGRSWSTGFAWTPSRRTSVQASIGRHFYGTTGSLAASLRSRRSVWSIDYGDTITNSRSQFTLPSALDTAALLDGLFSATITDPVLRAQAVADYIQQSGLPPSLANSINYLSNRYMRQKLLQASAAFKWSRSSAVMSLYGSERTALSSQEADSELLGSQLSSLNDNVRQRGASATYTYRLSPRSSLVAGASYSQSESLTTGLEDRQRLVRVGLDSKLGRHLTGRLELRRRSGGTGVGVQQASGRDYTENAIAATLLMTL